MISGVPKVAPSLAITRSQERARPRPPASTWPFGGAERGLAEARHQPEEFEEEVGGEVFLDQRGVGGETAEVGARAEDLVARAGEDDRADLFGVARHFHRRDDTR